MRTFKSRIDGTSFYSLLAVATAAMLYCLWVGYVVAWVVCMLGAVFLIARITGTEYRFLDDGHACRAFGLSGHLPCTGNGYHRRGRHRAALSACGCLCPLPSRCRAEAERGETAALRLAPKSSTLL